MIPGAAMSRDPLFPRAIRSLRQALAVDRIAESDADLLARFREANDPAAFEALVHRHGPGVLSASRKILSNDADIEDVFQAAFVILLRNARSIRKGQAVGAWLYGVAHRLALKTRAARRRREHVEARTPQRGPDASPDLSWAEACVVLHEELDRLPDKYRHPLMLCYLEGLSRDEAAERLGTSLNAIRNRLERGRSHLGARLSRRGISLSAGLLATVTSGSSVAVPPSLVRLTMGAIAKPSASVIALASQATKIGTLKIVGSMSLAAALLVGVAISDGALRAGPNPKAPQAKEAQPKSEVKKDSAKVEEATAENLSVKGRVFDPDGKPVQSAKIWLLREAWAVRRTAPGPKFVATTDADGSYSFTEKGEGRRRFWSEGAQIVATSEKLGLAWADATAAKEKPLDLKLAKDEPINGRILTLEGKPVAGVKIRVVEVSRPNEADLSSWLATLKANDRPFHEVHNKHFNHEGRLIEAGGPLPSLPESFITDGEGRFRISGLGRERVAELKIEGPGIATVWIHALTRKEPTLTVAEDPGDSRHGSRTYYGNTFDFAAQPSQPFEGIVIDRATGKPLAGVTVRGQWKWHDLATVTDKDGKYRLTGLEPGEHELMALPTADQPYHRMAIKGGAKASQRPVKLDFALTSGHWVTGKLINTRTNKPEANAPIWYFPFAEEPGYLSVPGSKAWSMDPVTHTKDDGTFRVVAFACRGAIVARGFGGGYIGAESRPLQGDVASLEGGLFGKDMLSTSPVVNLGSYHAAAIVNVDGKEAKHYTITLDPGIKVKVKLLDAAGKPVTGAGVGAHSTWGIWAPNQKEEVEILEYNPDRPRALMFLHPERGIGKVVEPTKGDVGPWTVVLEPTATATGRLVTDDGKPIANALIQVHYRLPGHDAWSPSTLKELRTNDKGEFRLTNMVGAIQYSISYSSERVGVRMQHYVRIQLKTGETKNLGDVKPREY